MRPLQPLRPAMNMFAHVQINKQPPGFCKLSQYLPPSCQEPVRSEQGWAPAPPQPGVYYDRDMEYIRDQVRLGGLRGHVVTILCFRQSTV